MSLNLKKYKEIKGFLSDYISQKSDKSPISLIAVTKNQPIKVVQEAINSKVFCFGENRVQEAFNKFKIIKENNNEIQLHMLGPLQTNKVKKALTIFDYFHTLDSEKLAKEFLKFSETLSNKHFFVQVNTGEEKQKSGIYPPEVNDFISHCIHDLKLNVIGLMCIPPILDEPRPHFQMLKKLAIENNVKHLSMGMSSDYKIAVESGASFIRIGTQLFGERKLI